MLNPAFPALNVFNSAETSPATNRYNCIAWAAGEDRRFWWPHPSYFWPKGAPRIVTIAAFVDAFATLGYSVCSNDRLDFGLQKVALYTLNGIPTHMARQLSDGAWTSKLGTSVDIRHKTLTALSGPAYGNPFLAMHRPLKVPGR